MSIEEGIVAVLDGLGGLRVSPEWPDSIQTDAAIVVGPFDIQDNDIAGCVTRQPYEVTFLFSMAGGVQRTHKRLMEYLRPSGAKSFRQALYANPTLQGNVQAFLWRGFQTPPGRIQIPARGFQAEVQFDEFYGAVVALEVYG